MASDPQTWAELKASVAEWLNRSDLTTKIPEFIAFAERRFNRTLIVPEREDVATLTAGSETVALPTDFWQARNLYIDADPRVQLEQVTLSKLRTCYPWQTTGKPQVYAISGENIILAPAPDTSYSLKLAYYKTIPALGASTATNWLLTDHPDIYLYGALLQAEAYVWNDGRLELWKTALDEAMGELVAAGNRKRYSGSPIRLRNPVGAGI